jgi:hypothetical protein
MASPSIILIAHDGLRFATQYAGDFFRWGRYRGRDIVRAQRVASVAEAASLPTSQCPPITVVIADGDIGYAMHGSN